MVTTILPLRSSAARSGQADRRLADTAGAGQGGHPGDGRGGEVVWLTGLRSGPVPALDALVLRVAQGLEDARQVLLLARHAQTGGAVRGGRGEYCNEAWMRAATLPSLTARLLLKLHRNPISDNPAGDVPCKCLPQCDLVLC